MHSLKNSHQDTFFSAVPVETVKQHPTRVLLGRPRRWIVGHLERDGPPNAAFFQLPFAEGLTRFSV